MGSKALTMGQAICIAAVCEFLGAVLLGASVTGIPATDGLPQPAAHQAAQDDMAKIEQRAQPDKCRLRDSCSSLA